MLARQADKHRYTVMMGRTHGVHAEPATLGLKFALWAQEFLRQRRRLAAARKEVAVGQAVGGGGQLRQYSPEIEAYVCAKLGLEPAPVSSQVLQRDRHAALMTTLALIAASIAKALEIRNLQRTETRSGGALLPGQKGSSAMPHKRQPRQLRAALRPGPVVRANSLAALENVALWHERDISHSSAERVILPDSTILVDYTVHRRRHPPGPPRLPRADAEEHRAFPGADFFGLPAAGPGGQGPDREEAYDLVQAAAMQVWQGAARCGRSRRSSPGCRSF